MNISKYNHKSTVLYEYLKSIYKSKYLWKKIFIFFGVALVVLTFSFVSRQLVLESYNRYFDLIPGFIRINVVGNTGISFSILKNASVSLIYFIQSMPIIISFFIIVFSRSIILDILFSILFFAGISNVIDRSIVDNYTHLNIIDNVNAVVDYLQFSFINNSAIFNVPDIFIILSSIFIVIYSIVSYFYTFGKRKTKAENKNNDSMGIKNEN